MLLVDSRFFKLRDDLVECRGLPKHTGSSRRAGQNLVNLSGVYSISVQFVDHILQFAWPEESLCGVLCEQESSPPERLSHLHQTEGDTVFDNGLFTRCSR